MRKILIIPALALLQVALQASTAAAVDHSCQLPAHRDIFGLCNYYGGVKQGPGENHYRGSPRSDTETEVPSELAAEPHSAPTAPDRATDPETPTNPGGVTPNDPPSEPETPPSDTGHPNNGHGNGDQTAPGNSGGHNNAENSEHSGQGNSGGGNGNGSKKK